MQAERSPCLAQASLPHNSLGPLLQRLRNVGGLDVIAPHQISSRAGQFQYAMVSRGGEIKRAHRRPRQTPVKPSTNFVDSTGMRYIHKVAWGSERQFHTLFRTICAFFP